MSPGMMLTFGISLKGRTRAFPASGGQMGYLPLAAVSAWPGHLFQVQILIWRVLLSPLRRGLCVGLAHGHTENVSTCSVTDDTQLSVPHFCLLAAGQWAIAFLPQVTQAPVKYPSPSPSVLRGHMCLQEYSRKLV